MHVSPVLKDVVLVGGGHAHVHVLKMFGMRRGRDTDMDGVQLTLITRDVSTPYSGMLPGHVAGLYTKEECHIDLMKLARFANAKLIHAEVCGMDIQRKLITCKDGRPPISYDVVTIDVGSCPYVYPNMGSSITPVKPIDGFSTRWNEIIERVVKSETNTDQRLSVVVVGAGAGGVELTFAMCHRLRHEFSRMGKDPRNVKVTLVSRDSSCLQGHNNRVKSLVLDALRTRDIEVLFGQEIVAAEQNGDDKVLVSATGTRIPFDECIWCTQAGGYGWVRNIQGLDLTQDGFITVTETLQSTSCSDVFAVGDCCHMVDNPRPKAGVFAVRQGPPLLNNLRAMMLGLQLEKYIPQSQWLQMIGTGDGDCIASRGPLGLQGRYLWTLKDHIDRTWMRGYQVLPNMSIDAPVPNAVAQISGAEALDILAHASMRCGGCGSKVGSSILSRALKKISHLVPTREEVIMGVNGRDDVGVIAAPPEGHLIVQTVDFFRAHVSDPYIFGRIAANHALSDCHAKNADAISALAIVVLPFSLEAKMEDVLVQVMAGACLALSEAGCALIGGHTSEGSELAIGFAVTGVIKRENFLRKTGVVCGHALVLTKAVGTGTIMAADMRAQAKGVWVVEAVESMLQSNREAARILHGHGGAACTDVTGFGLIGHLLEMISVGVNDSELGGGEEISELGVEISLDAVPLLHGAVECVEQGIFSSLQPQNIRNRRAVSINQDLSSDPRYAVMFDPQTAGGLLACVPPEQVEECVLQLKQAGYIHACQIGLIIDHVPLEQPIRIV